MNRISARAVVETEAIAAAVTIAEFAVVRPDVTIGNRVVIHPHVVIESGVKVGDNVEIFPGAYIGKAPKGAGALSRAPHLVLCRSRIRRSHSASATRGSCPRAALAMPFRTQRFSQVLCQC